MKVKIGSYPDRWNCSIHTRHMDKKYGLCKWEENKDRMDAFIEKLEDAIQSFYNIFNSLWFDRQEQKISVKIDPWDTWSMDHTLAHIVVPMLKQLKETKHGAPFVDYEDVPDDLRPAPEWYEKYSKNGETDPWFFERWDWVMDEMIWSFEQKTLDSWEDQYYGEWVEDESKMFGGYHVNPDDEGRKKHQERMNNGFRLFGKYYEGLWD